MYKAIMAISNNYGIGIVNIEYGIDDIICYVWINGDKAGKKTYAKVRYDEQGKAYFNQKHKFYLDMFIRSEYNGIM